MPDTDRRHPTPQAEAVIRERRSIRAFLPEPVDRATLHDILALASLAPSGTNTQPWRVHVVAGAVRGRLCDEITAAFLRGGEYEEEYAYAPDPWPEPYQARRRACGWGLYGALGISKGERERMQAQHARNFRFFDAPVGLFLTIERGLEYGSWLDLGLFLQTLMLAARAKGLDSCPQQAFAGFHKIIRRHLPIPDSEIVVCGVALGYADMSAPENRFQPERVPVEEFTQFHGELPG